MEAWKQALCATQHNLLNLRNLSMTNESFFFNNDLICNDSVGKIEGIGTKIKNSFVLDYKDFTAQNIQHLTPSQ
jgi:hypothetical protein